MPDRETTMHQHDLQIIKVGLLSVVMNLCACAGKDIVVVPSEIDLTARETVGLVQFEGQDTRGKDITKMFLDNIHSAQKGVLVLELGPEANLLKEVSRTQLNAKAIGLIGKEYNVKSIFVGDLKISEPQGKLKIGASLKDMSAGLYTRGSLDIKFYDSASGATVWTNSCSGNYKLGGISVGDRGLSGPLRISAPSDQYEKMMWDLANCVSRQLYATYRKEKRKK